MPVAGERARGRDIDLPDGYYIYLVCPTCPKERWAKVGGTSQRHPNGIAPCNDCRHAEDKVRFSELLERGKKRR